MNRLKYIRPVFALVMICLFAFSITPRKALHDLLGCHSQKSSISSSPEGGDSLAAATFKCSCDQPEFQLPFIESAKFPGFSAPMAYIDERPLPDCSPLFENNTEYSNLRGPPATA